MPSRLTHRHLVLSTLHTNSAPETITRLIEMGIDPLNVADSLLGVLAQRLVRVLCPECKEAYEPDAAEIEALTVPAAGIIPQPAVWKGTSRGCFVQRAVNTAATLDSAAAWGCTNCCRRRRTSSR